MWTQSLVAMEPILDVWRQCIPRRYVWTRLKTCSISLSCFVSLQSNSRLAVEQVRRSKSQEIRIRNRKTSTEKSPNPIVNSPPKVSSVMAFLSTLRLRSRGTIATALTTSIFQIWISLTWCDSNFYKNCLSCEHSHWYPDIPFWDEVLVTVFTMWTSPKIAM